MKRILIVPLLAACAHFAHSQDLTYHSAPRNARATKTPSYLPPIDKTPRTASNPYVRQVAGPAAYVAAANVPAPVRDANPDAALLEAIEKLSRRVDSLAASQMIDNEYSMSHHGAAASCGMEPMVTGCDACPPQIIYTQEAPQPVITISEPPLIQQRGGCFAGRSSGGTVMSGNASNGISANEAFQWRTSLCDLFFRANVRQVGPYRVEVCPGIFGAQVTVSP